MLQTLTHSELLHFNQVQRDRWVHKQLAMLAPGTLLLDVGCGSSPYRKAASHCDYRTQDFAGLSPAQLRDGGYAQIDYVCDATSIPVPDGAFEAVLSTEMLEHVPEPIRVVREMGRVLKPGGTLILTAPLGSGVHQEPYHFYGGYTPYWFERFLGEAGFESIKVEANGGFFRLFGQESLRFVQLSAPWRQRLPLALLWAPLWLALAPLLGLGLPALGKIIDRFDTTRHFTVGYFVTATKKV